MRPPRRSFVIKVLACVSIVFLFISSGFTQSLPESFKNPPRKYTMRPFWFWAGKIDTAEVARQIREMCSQGVYGAFVHARGNLETRYLSEEWWKVIGYSLKVARDEGFHFCVIDEYEWPGGEARDIWNPGLPSKVLQKFPQYRMKHLVPYEHRIKGPQAVSLEIKEKPHLAYVFQINNDSSLVLSSMKKIDEQWNSGRLTWNAPEGEWIIQEFRLEPTQGIDGGLVDLLNPSAIREFMNLTHEEYYRRFGDYFGKEMDMFYSDHEGDEGRELAWTPELFDEFQREKGYDLREVVPLLARDAGDKSIEVRYDYLDVVSNLYTKSFFAQEEKWVREHNTHITGHLWESPLSRLVEFSGDHFRMFRAWDTPGIDALLDWGRSPKDFKEVASISHFKNMLFTCENQGLHGWDTWFDLQKARLGTNGCGAWGVSMFIPHAFNYMQEQIIYPPDWFFHQPFWKYFRHYADYVRRISYMNATGVHSAPLLIYFPITSAFAAMGNIAVPSGDVKKWKPEIHTLEADYIRLQEGLVNAQWDYDVTDDSYLSEARFDGGKILIGAESYGALVLPPMKYIREVAAKKIMEYIRQGGTVISWKSLPEGSPIIKETPEVRRILVDAFGKEDKNYLQNSPVVIKDSIDAVIGYLDRTLRADTKVESGPREHLFVYHTKNQGKEIYWLVNDSDRERENLLSFPFDGMAERWDAESGEQSRLYSYAGKGRTFVPLHFDAWDAFYIVIDPQKKNTSPQVVSTTLRTYEIAGVKAGSVIVKGYVTPGDKPAAAEILLEGKRYVGRMDLAHALREEILPADGWKFSCDSPVSGVYARVTEDPVGRGRELGYHLKEHNDKFWREEWLSKERMTVRDWMIIGPFANDAHEGFVHVYPPEKEMKWDAEYEGKYGSVRWQRHIAPEYYIDLGKTLDFSPRQWVVSYACTFVFSPEERNTEMLLAMDNNARVWVNGEDILSVDVHPFYYRMRDAFAFRRPVHLKQGWNQVLLKIGLGRSTDSGVYGFMFKLVDAEGRLLSNVDFSPVKERPGTPVGTKENPMGKRWYRIIIPPGTKGMQMPDVAGPMEVYFNGQAISVVDGIYRFPAHGGTGNIAAIAVPENQEISDYITFLPGTSETALGSWTFTGLSYYIGSARYDRIWEMPEGWSGNRIQLDLGTVGSAAEVWVNGKKAGERVWLPFRFDITGAVRPGKNDISILITNTDAANEAMGKEVGSWTAGYILSGQRRLEFINVNGLIGPVKIVPETMVELECREE
jgi:hypothetical protein